MIWVDQWFDSRQSWVQDHSIQSPVQICNCSIFSLSEYLFSSYLPHQNYNVVLLLKLQSFVDYFIWNLYKYILIEIKILIPWILSELQT